MEGTVVIVAVLFGLHQALLASGQNVVGITLQSDSLNLPNNAIVSANQIGPTESLICFTDNTTFNIGQWFSPDGSLVQTNPSDTVYNLRGPGSVMLYRTRGLTPALEGIYTCRIPDSEGREHVLFVGIYTQDNFVIGSPIIPNKPSFSLATPLDQFPPTFSLSCLSTSYPPTSVTWLLDNQPIDTSDDDEDTFIVTQSLLNAATTSFDNTLTVMGNYSGQFTCLISNSIGVTNNSYTVTVPATPPSLMEPDFLGSGNVNITWTPPEGVVSGYQLFYRLSSAAGSEVVVNITRPRITHQTLFSLLAGATYSVSILAYSDLPTERSDVLEITLNVAGTAQNISIMADSATALNITWTRPGDGVIGYNLYYTPTGTGCPGVFGGVVNGIPDSTHYLLTGLEEDTEYNVTLSTISEAAVGDPSHPVAGTTLIKAPSSPPVNVTVTTQDPDTVFITWQPPPCLEQNGPITNYTLQFIDLVFSNTPSVESDIIANNVTLVGRISAFRNVSFQLLAVNEAGTSSLATPIYAHLIGDPGTVRSLTVIGRDITSVTLAWVPNPLIQLIFTRDFTYTISWTLPTTPNEVIGSVEGVSTTQYEVPFLYPNTSYQFSVTPVSSYAPGQPQTRTGTTIVFGTVTRLTVVQDTESSVNVSFVPIDSRDILFYEVYYNETANMNQSVRVNLTRSSPLLVTITGLDSESNYHFTVAGFASSNEGSVISGPLSVVREFTFTVDNDMTLLIIIVCSSVGGALLLIVVIIVTIFFLTVLSKNLGPELANKSYSTKETYIPLTFFDHTLEEDTDSPLPTSATPTITGDLSGDIHSVEGQEVVIRFVVNGNPSPSLKWTLDDEDIDWEGASFMHREGTIIFTRVEVEHAGLYKLKAVNANGNCDASVKLIVYPDTEITRHPSESEAITSVSVVVGGLGQYVASLHANGNKLFREQFRMLSSGEAAHPVNNVLADENRPYNRFQHILVYDNNRIKLEILPRYLDCQHEYINACYVKGEGEKCRQFIATQGPLEHSVADMWRLVWQERAPVIVMLTKTKEDLRIKCSQYWPSKGSGEYGPFTVTLLQETTFTGYIVREFSVHYNSMTNNIRSRLVNPIGSVSIDYKEPFSKAKSTLRVTQYQYTEWLEHCTADNVPALLEMHQKAVSLPTIHPIVVHCSNGVGRTGAFIALDMGLEQCNRQDTVDIPAIVTDIRNQRMKMIQTLDQFMLVHDAIIEKVICGDNSIHVKTLHTQMKTLEQNIGKSNKTGYENQFTILDQVSVAPDNAACSYAKQFPRKNRPGHALPTNQWRVALKGESPDYINATYVTGFNNPRAFVVTQGPLKDTRREFWKMVYDQEVATIVMLSTVVEDDTEVCVQYWPSTGSVEFGEFVIIVKDTFENDGFTRRILVLKDTKTNSLRRVVQYQVKGWGSGGRGFTGVVNTINLVATTQRKTPDIPVLVHCSNGMGRSPMFCVAMANIERCKVEGIVDMFHVVKTMRGQLPGAVETKDQYKTIHHIVTAYLSLFSTSANFEDFD